jgi:hypothetical protein
MTIRDLVSHRSGFDTFSGDLLWYETTYNADEILRRVRYLKPKSSFRSSYGYQNLMLSRRANRRKSFGQNVVASLSAKEF